MKDIKLSGIVVTSLAIILLYLFMMQSSLFIGDLTGKYVLYSDGNCHFLSSYSDTLVLKKDGSVESRNFRGEATYTVDIGAFEKRIDISYYYGKEGMGMPIERNWLGEIKIRVCVDLDTYYLKIK